MLNITKIGFIVKGIIIPSSSVDASPFTIKYSKEWFDDTVSKVTSVLNSTIPVFVNHTHLHTVRKACAAFSATVIEHCEETLSESQRILLETLFEFIERFLGASLRVCER